MEHISDFTQGQDKIVLDLVNHDNLTNLSLSQVQVGLVTPSVEGRVSVELVAVPGAGYTGSQSIDYSRLDIKDFFDLYFPSGIVLQEGNAKTLLDFLPEINTAIGTAIDASSVVDSQLVWLGTPNELLSVPFTIAASSKIYQGTAQLSVDGNDIALADIVTVNILSGLRLPGQIDTVDYQPLVDAMVYPFEANVDQSEQEVIDGLSRYLGVPSGSISFAPGTVLPSLAFPEVEVVVFSNQPEVGFAGGSQTIVELGIGKFTIPNADFKSYVSQPANWTWHATRGWYNDVSQPDTGLASLHEQVGLSGLFGRLKKVGGTFTQYPLQASNGLGANYIAINQDTVLKRVGIWDQFNGTADQWLYYEGIERRLNGDKVNQHYSMSYLPPNQRAPITQLRFASGWRVGFNKGIRGMKDIYLELYVTKAPVKSKFFRLLVEATQSEAHAEMKNLYLYDKDGVNQLTSSRVVVANDSSRHLTQASATYGPLNLVEDHPLNVAEGSKWTSAANLHAGSWVSFELNEEIEVKSVGIQNETASRSPTTVQLQTSVDGVTWITAFRSPVMLDWTAVQTRTFDV